MMSPSDYVKKLALTNSSSCKICGQQTRLIPDPEAAVRWIGTNKCFTVGRPVKQAEDRLCYYHWKKKEGLFDTDEIYLKKREAFCARFYPKM